ncbi:hypothetical protein EDC04DRAFT_2757961 [Pisolithus marmoratus]|nr:hypothetical protein EDC04DRAFT_2757961 [Pisolithus marmoratus]
MSQCQECHDGNWQRSPHVVCVGYHLSYVQRTNYGYDLGCTGRRGTYFASSFCKVYHGERLMCKGSDCLDRQDDTIRTVQPYFVLSHPLSDGDWSIIQGLSSVYADLICLSTMYSRMNLQVTMLPVTWLSCLPPDPSFLFPNLGLLSIEVFGFLSIFHVHRETFQAVTCSRFESIFLTHSTSISALFHTTPMPNHLQVEHWRANTRCLRRLNL